MDPVTAGSWSGVTFAKQDAVQVRTEVFALVSDDLVVMEFDLEIDPTTKFFVADLALLRIRITGESIHLRFDQIGELHTGNGFVRLESLVLQVAVEPDGFRFAQRGVDSDAHVAHPLLAPLLDVPTQSLASTVN